MFGKELYTIAALSNSTVLLAWVYMQCLIFNSTVLRLWYIFFHCIVKSCKNIYIPTCLLIYINISSREDLSGQCIPITFLYFIGILVPMEMETKCLDKRVIHC